MNQIINTEGTSNGRKETIGKQRRMVSRDEYGVYIYRNAEMSDSDKVLRLRDSCFIMVHMNCSTMLL